MLSNHAAVSHTDGRRFDVIVMDPPWENKSVKRSRRQVKMLCRRGEVTLLPQWKNPFIAFYFEKHIKLIISETCQLFVRLGPVCYDFSEASGRVHMPSSFVCLPNEDIVFCPQPS